MKNKIQERIDSVDNFLKMIDLSEREKNLLRGEKFFLLELKADAEALNITPVIVSLK